jgi:hypothetical protein
MKRSTLGGAVILLVSVLAGCGPAAATPASPGVAASGVARASAGTGASGGARDALDQTAAGLVPAILPNPDLEEGASAGAYGIAIDDASGRTTAGGQASCYWDRSAAAPTLTSLASDPTTLFGEQVEVQIADGHTPVLRRADGARYIPTGGSLTAPRPVGEAIVVHGSTLAVDPADPLPVGEDKASYYQPLGGLAAATHLDVAIAWRCDPPAATPSPSAEAEDPTPACPPAVSGSPAPIAPLMLASGSHRADGSLFSSEYVSCTDDVVGDGEWSVPDKALAVAVGSPMTLTASGPGALSRVTAFYAPAGSDATPTSMETLAVQPGSTPNEATIDAPPAGDWAVVVSAVINDTDHGIVRDETYVFRVKSAP